MQTYAAIPIGGSLGIYRDTLNNNMESFLSSSAGSSAPAYGVEGTLWYDTATGRLKVKGPSTWATVFDTGGSVYLLRDGTLAMTGDLNVGTSKVKTNSTGFILEKGKLTLDNTGVSTTSTIEVPSGHSLQIKDASHTPLFYFHYQGMGRQNVPFQCISTFSSGTVQQIEFNTMGTNSGGNYAGMGVQKEWGIFDASNTYHTIYQEVVDVPSIHATTGYGRVRRYLTITGAWSNVLCEEIDGVDCVHKVFKYGFLDGVTSQIYANEDYMFFAHDGVSPLRVNSEYAEVTGILRALDTTLLEGPCLSVIDGTAGSPCFRMGASSQYVGLYKSASGRLGFSTNGTARAHLDSTDFFPETDSGVGLGKSGKRWGKVWFTPGGAPSNFGSSESYPLVVNSTTGEVYRTSGGFTGVVFLYDQVTAEYLEFTFYNGWLANAAVPEEAP